MVGLSERVREFESILRVSSLKPDARPRSSAKRFRHSKTSMRTHFLDDLNCQANQFSTGVCCAPVEGSGEIRFRTPEALRRSLETHRLKALEGHHFQTNSLSCAPFSSSRCILSRRDQIGCLSLSLSCLTGSGESLSKITVFGRLCCWTAIRR